MGKLIDINGLTEFKSKLQEWVNNTITSKKNVQSSKESPSASGNALAFIDTISQDAQGVITATKKNVTVDTSPTQNSTNPVSSGALYDVRWRLGSQTTDVQASALTLTTSGIYAFHGAGSSYTGSVPTSNHKYGVFIVLNRSGTYWVLSIYDYNIYVSKYVNGNWSAWHHADEYALSQMAYFISPPSSTATKAMARGSLVFWNDQLYQATADIANGDTLSESNVSTVSNGGLNYLNTRIMMIEKSSGDFNNFVPTQYYRTVYCGTDISQFTNIPSSVTTTYPFTLDVYTIGPSSNYIEQVLHVHSIAELTFTRRRYSLNGSLTWGEWQCKSHPVLIINCGTISSLPVTITDARIDNSMIVVQHTLGTPTANIGDWTITTGNGSVTISGAISGSTTLNLWLCKAR